MTETTPLQMNENNPKQLADIISAIESTHDLNFVTDYSDAEIANILESVNFQYRHLILESIPSERYWGILNLLQYETAKHIHQSLPEEVADERLLLATESDVITFAEFLPSEFVDEFLLRQSDETVAHIQQVLSYEEDMVGRYAESFFLVANVNNSVGRIKNELLKRDDQPIYLIIVRDSSGFVGTVTPETLLISKPEEKMRALMLTSPILQDTQDIYEVSKQIAIDGESHWYPIQSEGKIMGILSMTNIALRLRELSLQTVLPDTARSEEDLFTPLKVAARLRAVWLVINLITAFAASAIIGIFENVVEQVVALAILMPVVASMGGIAGSQTLAVSLRGIALNHLHRSNLGLLVSKEIKIAIINGVVMGAAIAAVVYFVFHSVALSLIIFCAIGLNSLASALSGTLIPFTLNKFNIDPAIAGSVVLTTVTDVVGFLVFLGLGAIFLV